MKTRLYRLIFINSNRVGIMRISIEKLILNFDTHWEKIWASSSYLDMNNNKIAQIRPILSLKLIWILKCIKYSYKFTKISIFYFSKVIKHFETKSALFIIMSYHKNQPWFSTFIHNYKIPNRSKKALEECSNDCHKIKFPPVRIKRKACQEDRQSFNMDKSSSEPVRLLSRRPSDKQLS